MATFFSVLVLLLVVTSSHSKEEKCSSEVLVLTKEEIKRELKQTFESIVHNHYCNSSDLDVLEAVSKIGWRLSTKIDGHLLLLEETLDKIVVQRLEPVLARINALHWPGKSPSRPAVSCKEILSYDSSTPSGNYWIQAADGRAVSRYCDMNRVCGGVSGGWMRIAKLDMRNSSNQCPSGLRERVHPGQRLCGMNINGGGCSQAYFETHNIRYDQVCGKIIAYQFGSPDAFGLAPPRTRTIDQGYLDGIGLTYDSNPRKHIWSFAAALDEAGSRNAYVCPCTNVNTASSATPPPDFVGNDYFCDTGSSNRFSENVLYADDPLWDGAGCGPANTCCSLNNPPWFFKQLLSSTSEDIEMRVCCNQDRRDEDVRIEQIEIYVR